MNRFVALLIIPFLAIGHAFPHSHEKAYALGDHAARPHVHIRHGTQDHADHHHHGDHCEQSDESANEMPVDHDSDAVYLSGGHFFLPHSDNLRGGADLDSFEYLSPRYALAAVEVRPFLVGYEVPVQDDPPLFLLHAALRL